MVGCSGDLGLLRDFRRDEIEPGYDYKGSANGVDPTVPNHRGRFVSARIPRQGLLSKLRLSEPECTKHGKLFGLHSALSVRSRTRQSQRTLSSKRFLYIQSPA